jgi:hypothetical protein
MKKNFVNYGLASVVGLVMLSSVASAGMIDRSARSFSVNSDAENFVANSIKVENVAVEAIDIPNPNCTEDEMTPVCGRTEYRKEMMVVLSVSYDSSLADRIESNYSPTEIQVYFPLSSVSTTLLDAIKNTSGRFQGNKNQKLAQAYARINVSDVTTIENVVDYNNSVYCSVDPIEVTCRDQIVYKREPITRRNATINLAKYKIVF